MSHTVATRGAGIDTRIGPPPPSPPASIKEYGVDTAQTNGNTSGSKIVFDEPEALPDDALAPHDADKQCQASSSSMQRSSTDTKGSLLDSSQYLQPPSMHRAARRHTTSFSTPRMAAQQQQVDSQEDISDDVANDIELHAEKIRRERMEKRAKQQQAEAALTRSDTKKGEDAPLVGNLIGEDHVNYVLMYNMLTGIRIGVRIFTFLLVPVSFPSPSSPGPKPR